MVCCPQNNYTCETDKRNLHRVEFKNSIHVIAWRN
jgi:hypothetical protein